MNLLPSRRPTLQALDVEAIVTYNSFDSLYHYYSEMSAMGDRPPEFRLHGLADDAGSRTGGEEWGRIANVSVPFAVLQALDDPLLSWRTIGTNDPQRLAEAGKGNILLLLTKVRTDSTCKLASVLMFETGTYLIAVASRVTGGGARWLATGT